MRGCFFLDVKFRWSSRVSVNRHTPCEAERLQNRHSVSVTEQWDTAIVDSIHTQWTDPISPRSGFCIKDQRITLLLMMFQNCHTQSLVELLDCKVWSSSCFFFFFFVKRLLWVYDKKLLRDNNTSNSREVIKKISKKCLTL